MALTLASQFTQRSHSWTNWKAVASAKNIIYQYDDDGLVYRIYGYDGPEIHLCIIWKAEVPYEIVNGGYSQVQNDADKLDFETNYLPTANHPVDTRGILTDYSGTTSATPNTSTQIMPAHAHRQYLFIQNVGDNVFWINFTNAATAGQPSIKMHPGASFVMEGVGISTEAICVLAETASVPYTAKES